ncbi:hypothetical protein [Olivibacter sitiensis]|uniref:hypothetical protein n=1 Tax=Olivibacter sitiensis TaxID=376470 RepID=UPI0003FDB189|nr:hypothetical protein [Olivibacter sitiensis]
MNKYFITAILAALIFVLQIERGVFAQGSVGQIGSLVTAEYNTASMAKDKSLLTALRWASDKNTIWYTPSPVSTEEYLGKKPSLPDVMTWQPTFAKVAMSDEWGFTTGPISWQSVGRHKQYGEYLSLWKRNPKGEWKLAFRAISEHGKPVFKASKVLENPQGEHYVRLRSKARLKQRIDIIASTDQLFATILKADNPTAFKEFYTEETRMYVPSFEPVIGESAAQGFLTREKLAITSEPGTTIDRSYSGELAFSTGEATISSGTMVKHCDYLRIWEKQEDNLWKVIVDMYIEKK